SKTVAISDKAAALKSEGKKIVSLSVGEPDVLPAPSVMAAAHKALDAGHVKYTECGGLKALREAICDYLQQTKGLTYKVNEIVCSNGGKQSLLQAMLALLDPGDEVIVPAPYWVSYPDVVQFAGAVPVIVPAGAEYDYKLTPAMLEAAITPQTKWVILNSPSNPTGAAYSADELKALGAVLERHPHVWVFADDMYEHIVYDDFQFATIAQVCPSLYERTLTVNGCSKAYAMTGWRIGFAAGAPWLIKAMAKLQSQSTSNPCSIAQAAAVAALTGDQSFLKERAAAFQTRRDLVVSMLNAADGITGPRPEGAFYVYPDIAGVIGKTTPDGKRIESDSDFVTYLLDDARVAAVQGVAFGLSPAMRISYATSEALLTEACTRIQTACAALR
ncbi:MAG: pyridoxal phosphate-dependent aminotransferase, partial [Pseudomonadota bacterium]|nr:pyridoxal phosphate-dependent aminotransferase [Pseudomonadota bacterium]